MERETMCIQAGYSPKNGESRMIPIIQSTESHKRYGGSQTRRS